MPRVKRRGKHRRAGWTEAHREHLLTGYDWSAILGGGFGPDPDVAVLGEAWRELRDALLPAWIAEHPGRRPWAWWQFDAPEPRRRIGTMRLRPGSTWSTTHRVAVDYEFVAAETAHTVEVDRRCWFGRPAVLVTLDDFGAVFESEVEYLRRHGLLTSGELARRGADLMLTK